MYGAKQEGGWQTSLEGRSIYFAGTRAWEADQVLDGLLEDLTLPGQLLLSLCCKLPLPLHLSLLSQQCLVLAHHQFHLHTSQAFSPLLWSAVHSPHLRNPPSSPTHTLKPLAPQEGLRRSETQAVHVAGVH